MILEAKEETAKREIKILEKMKILEEAKKKITEIVKYKRNENHSFLFASWMTIYILFFYMFFGNMRINLRSRYTTMP